jgi:hypothetical protein
MPNSDSKAPVRILNAGTPRLKLSLSYSLSIPRVSKYTGWVRILQAQKWVVLCTLYRSETTWTVFV